MFFPCCLFRWEIMKALVGNVMEQSGQLTREQLDVSGRWSFWHFTISFFEPDNLLHFQHQNFLPWLWQRFLWMIRDFWPKKSRRQFFSVQWKFRLSSEGFSTTHSGSKISCLMSSSLSVRKSMYSGSWAVCSSFTMIRCLSAISRLNSENFERFSLQSMQM